MSFEILEKSPQVAPLLVRLYDTHNLYSLAGNKDSVDARIELATIMVDLMSVKLNDTESELITDVMFALMKQAETDLKQALAERLSTLEGIPLRMVLALANEEISIAEPVLRSSPVLDDMDLIYILQAKGASHARAIAQREGLSATLVNMLADTKDFETAVNLSNNDGVALTNHAYDIFASMAKKSEDLAGPLLHRDDLPKDIATELYSFVSSELKKVVTERFGDLSAAANIILDEIASEIRDPESRMIENYDLLMAQAHLLQRRGELKVAGMISCLRRGQYTTFMVQFSVFSMLPFETVKSMLKQDGGKGLAIACRALDIIKADFISIYLLTERFRTTGGKRVITHTELSRLMTMFDEIDAEDARRTIRSTRH